MTAPPFARFLALRDEDREYIAAVLAVSDVQAERIRVGLQELAEALGLAVRQIADWWSALAPLQPLADEHRRREVHRTRVAYRRRTRARRRRS